MKRVTCIILVLILCFVVTTGISEHYRVVTQDGDGLNVRDSKRNGNVIGVLHEGTVVEVISTDGRWATIEYKGQIAYVYLQYLRQTSDTTSSKKKTARNNDNVKEYTNEDTVAYRVILSVSSFVNVRKQPKNDGTSVAKIYRGDEVDVREIKGSWAHIVWNKKLRYVPARYLELVDENIEQLETESGWYLISPRNKNVNAYNEPSVDSKIRKNLKKGQIVYVAEDFGAWVYVLDEDWKALGYMLSSNLIPY